jgi:hypothetical protein
VVELVPLDEVLANGGDYLDDEGREHRSSAPLGKVLKVGDLSVNAIAVSTRNASTPGVEDPPHGIVAG